MFQAFKLPEVAFLVSGLAAVALIHLEFKTALLVILLEICAVAGITAIMALIESDK